jgi:hypothetical protein
LYVDARERPVCQFAGARSRNQGMDGHPHALHPAAQVPAGGRVEGGRANPSEKPANLERQSTWVLSRVAKEIAALAATMPP